MRPRSPLAPLPLLLLLLAALHLVRAQRTHPPYGQMTLAQKGDIDDLNVQKGYHLGKNECFHVVDRKDLPCQGRLGIFGLRVYVALVPATWDLAATISNDLSQVMVYHKTGICFGDFDFYIEAFCARISEAF